MVKWVGLVSAVCFMVSYLPQLVRTYRTREVRGVSPLYWAIVVLGYVSGLAYILPFRDPFLWLTYSGGFVCASAMLVGYLAFRRR